MGDAFGLSRPLDPVREFGYEGASLWSQLRRLPLSTSCTIWPANPGWRAWMICCESQDTASTLSGNDPGLLAKIGPPVAAPSGPVKGKLAALVALGDP